MLAPLSCDRCSSILTSSPGLDFSLQGVGGAGDYLLTSQANEHAIVFHRWGKTQPVFKVSHSRSDSPITRLSL